MTIAPSFEPEHGLLTAAAIAAIFSVQPKTIYNWADAGLIPVAIRVGHTIRFNLDDVTQALNEATRDAQFSRMKKKGLGVDVTPHGLSSCDRQLPLSNNDLALPG